MVEKETIKLWIEEEYNDFISVFVNENFVRITNGSPAHAVDIYPEGPSFIIEGEKYGETIADSCDADRESLMKTLERNI